MAHDGFPQGVVDEDFLVLNVHELADAAVQRARGIGPADLALAWDAKHRYAPAAPHTHARPGPGDLGVGQSLQRESLLVSDG